MSPFDFFKEFDRHIQPEPNSGCWLWRGTCTPSRNPYGTGCYGWFRWKRVQYYAHRCAYEAVHGWGSADGWLVRHRCDVPICVNPDHLEIGTVADNSRDQKERGRSLRGERATNSKLTDAKVLDIRRLFAAGIKQPVLAAQFGVDQSLISLVVTGKRWGHLMHESAATRRPSRR